MMKTIRQWLKEGLSKDDYKKAKKYENAGWESEMSDFESAIFCAFTWYATKEGLEYWDKICLNGGSLPTDNDLEWSYTKCGIATLVSHTTDPIVEAVCNDLRSRSAIGIKKYGKTLDRDDMDATDWAREMFHELLDAALYCKRLIKELEKIKQDESKN